jgi:hypothetical protein
MRLLLDAWEALYVAKLDECGEHDMAQLFRTDRLKFEQLRATGCQFFRDPGSGAETSGLEWLSVFLESVGACIESDSPMGPLGLRYGEEDGAWEVLIYPTPVELVGGAHDGAVVAPGFTLDLEQLRALFDTIAASGWQTLGLADTEGPHLYVEGVYQGRDVFLRVLALAPEDEEPGLKFHTTDRPQRPK